MPRKPKAKPNPRWHKFRVKNRRGAWVAVFGHPRETRTRVKNGKAYVEPIEVLRVLKHADGSAPVDDADAFALADVLYDWLEVERIRVRENGPQEQITLAGDRVRWPIAPSIDDWLTEKYPHRATFVTNRAAIQEWRAFIDAEGIRFFDELAWEHVVRFHECVSRLRMKPRAESQSRDALPEASPRTKDHVWSLTKTFARWAFNKGRLARNVFRERDLPGFNTKRKRDRRNDNDIRIVPPADWPTLLGACRTVQEKLMFRLCTQLGLRNAEVVHLKWADYVRYESPPILTITQKQIDANGATETWLPKTGERRVPVIYPEIVELLEIWRRATPHGNTAVDWIFADPITGERYQEVPQKFFQRLRKTTGIDWTPQIGRHTACSIFVHLCETHGLGSWNEHIHERFFGHDANTARDYYLYRAPFDLRAQLGLKTATDAPANADTPDEETFAGNVLDAQTAKDLLAFLIATTATNPYALAPRIGISDTAIRKFLTTGKSIPLWFATAIRELITK